MEKYLMAILVLMPGFLAINTAEKLGKTHTKKSGAAWALYLSDWVLGRCNALNKARGKNIRWEEGSLFHHLFNDGQPHFLIVRKDGEDIAVGFFDACSDPQDEKNELSVVEFPEYREEWDLVKKGEKDSYLHITLRTYVDASSGLTVIETQYPPEWLSDR